MERTTKNSRILTAKIESVYNAFADSRALVHWLAPDSMTGRIHNFDFRVSGGYEMSLYYKGSEEGGKTSGNEDRFISTFTEIVPNERITQKINFQSDDPDFQGDMIMEVLLRTVDQNKTEVIIIFKNIPKGIKPEDNHQGTEESLKKLERFVKDNAELEKE
jgi:uncharacterized protein YndB with AHSA1/START domain